MSLIECVCENKMVPWLHLQIFCRTRSAAVAHLAGSYMQTNLHLGQVTQLKFKWKIMALMVNGYRA